MREVEALILTLFPTLVLTPTSEPYSHARVGIEVGIPF